VKDDYAVTEVRLAYEWHGDDSDAAVETATLPFEQQKELFGKAEFDFDDVFDLQPLEIPTGVTLTFKAEAVDNDTISGPKTGQCPEFLVRVVTEEQLRTDLLRREKEQRQEFERLLNDQEVLLTEIQALAADTRDAGPFDKDQKDKIRDSQRRQKLIGTNIGTIARRLETFLVEAQNNRLEEEGGPFQRRLARRIIEPMSQLADSDIPLAEDGLHKTRRLDTEAPDRSAALAERAAALDEVIAKQQYIVDQMREILTHMVKAEGFQEAVNMLYELEKAQKGVFDLTTKELQELIKRILEQGGDAESPKKDGASPSPESPE
jgi:hypothetical protein